jgi:hypothetical protein
MANPLAAFLCILLGIAAVASAQPATTLPTRQPKYPPKTARTLFSDQQIARARENIKKYPAAKKVADGITNAADEWVSWNDDDLTFLLTTPDVPRAFAVSATGCPVCGGKIRQKGNGDYAWLIDPKIPFKVKCPVDGTVFPDNDYATYYRSGFKEKKGWDNKYVDDGWGWADPKTGEKFWFVAYYNHWMWHKHLVPAMNTLARAYLLTGDLRYAHKAAVMLYRVAQVYPGMDHAKQSRYGTMMAARGINYPGKVVNAIWETNTAIDLADAYDGVFDAIDRDETLQKQTGKTGPQIRSFIEANVLEDAVDAVFQSKIRGNFGMHQASLVHLARVRQTGDSEKWFDWLMSNSSPDYPTLGLNYALYDLIYRDGVPSEQAPGYNIIWIKKISEYGDLLQQAGRDVFGISKTKRLYDGVLDQMLLGGQFTSCVGDSGSVWGQVVGKDIDLWQTACRRFPNDQRYLRFLDSLGGSGEQSFRTFESLFEEPIPSPQGTAPPPPASWRLLDGYGMAILGNRVNTTAAAIYYGQRHGHGHFDRLNLDLFAHGTVISPDLGYPDAMNDFVPGIYTWSKNTISHNAVTVDAHRQLGEGPGEVQLFADSPFARVVDIEAKETYPQCSSYRRAVIMVDVGEGQSYFVDIFTVAGGKQHDYSLHGPPGKFEMIGGQWSDPAKGTLAGENVAVGEIYDDANLAKAGPAAGGYSAYTGSGFQHLYNVRTLQKNDPWVAQFAHEKNPKSMLRIRILDQPGQQLFLCDARVSPVNYPQVLKYLIARRSGEKLASRFVSIIEPYKDGKPIIDAVTPVKLPYDDGCGLEIRYANGEVDEIVYDPVVRNTVVPSFVDLHPQVAVMHYQARKSGHYRGEVQRSFFASTKSNSMALRGKVSDILPLRCAVSIALENPPQPLDLQALVGRVVHFRNDRHRTTHTISAAERDGTNLLLSVGDDLRVGLAKVDALEPQAIITSTALPLAPTYRGATVCDELFRNFTPVASVGGGKINLAKPWASAHGNPPFKPGDNVWLLDVAPGDTIEVPWISYSSEGQP